MKFKHDNHKQGFSENCSGCILTRYMSEKGKNGGRASADSKTPERRKEIAMMGVKARLKNKAERERLLLDKAV